MSAADGNPFYNWGKENDEEVDGIPASEIAFELDDTVSPQLLDSIFHNIMNQVGVIANNPRVVESTMDGLIELWKGYRNTSLGLNISTALVEFAGFYLAPEHSWHNQIYIKRATFNTRKLLTRINDYRNRGIEVEGSLESENMQIILDGINFLEPLS